MRPAIPIDGDHTSNAQLVAIAQQMYEQGKQLYCDGWFRDAGGAFLGVEDVEKHLAERIGPDAAIRAVGIAECDLAWAHYLADARVPEYRILNLQSPDKRGCPGPTAPDQAANADATQAHQTTPPESTSPAVAASESVPAPPSPTVTHGKWTVETQDARYPIADVSSLIPETATKVELKAYTLRSDKPPVVVMKWRDGGYHSGVAVKGASDAWDVLAKSDRDLYEVQAAELIPGSHQLVWYNIAGSGSFLALHVLAQTDNGLESRLHLYGIGGIRKVTIEGDRLWYNDPVARHYHRWDGTKFVDQRVALSEVWPANTKIVHYWLDKTTQKVQFEPVKLDLRVGDVVGFIQKGEPFLEVIRAGDHLEWDDNHSLKAYSAGTTHISLEAKFGDAQNDVTIPVHIEP